MEMDLKDWSVDLNDDVAIHSSGLVLVFDGHPSSNNFSVTPSRPPKGIDNLTWVRLIRFGTESFRSAFAKTNRYKETPVSPPKVVINTRRSLVDPQVSALQ